MDVEDSLELLSSHFTNPTVRRYAVARLQQADDEVFTVLSSQNVEHRGFLAGASYLQRHLSK